MCTHRHTTQAAAKVQCRSDAARAGVLSGLRGDSAQSVGCRATRGIVCGELRVCWDAVENWIGVLPREVQVVRRQQQHRHAERCVGSADRSGAVGTQQHSRWRL